MVGGAEAAEMEEQAPAAAAARLTYEGSLPLQSGAVHEGDAPLTPCAAAAAAA